MPSSQNVPLHKEKNEVKVAGSVGTSLEVNSYDVQASATISDNLAVMINTQIVRGINSERFDEFFGTGHMFELAVGYYNPYAKNLTFEAFLGAGGGVVLSEYEDNLQSRISYNRIFLQPQIGHSSEYIDFAISSRIVLLNYDRPTFSMIPPEDILSETNELSRRGARVLLEPAMTMRAGKGPVKFQLQIVLSTGPDRFDEFKREYINMSAGLLLSL
ncbi:MAG: hypothetical protein WBA74_00655 [Cyclobacteriaceae bacterium]